MWSWRSPGATALTSTSRWRDFCTTRSRTSVALSSSSRTGYLTRLARTPGAVLIKRADIENNSDPARRAHLDEKTQERLTAKYAHYLEMLGDGQ
ncbi:MAG TPA: hypothetical protein VFH76_24370 [Kribbella sp.]|nr:hypothetical protein [Kribbella sp.]